MSERSILHVLPRCIGGGPERSVIAMAKEAQRLGRTERRTMVVLDPPVTPVMLLQARRAGIELVTRFDDDAFSEMARASDVVHLHFWNHPKLYALLRRVELPPARVLVTAHVSGTGAPQSITEEVGRFADHLIVTSAISLGTPGVAAAPAVTVLRSIIDRSRLETPPTAPDRDPSAVVVGYLGSLNETKLHPRIVELCSQVSHPAVRFRFFGSGAEPHELIERFGAAGLADRVEVHGPVEDIASALAGMDVFGYPLAPHTFATSDRTLQEAMWMGVAPVVLAGSGPSKLVSHERSGLVVDEAGYPAAIDRLASDAALRKRLGEQARAEAHERFDPEQGTLQMLTLMDQLGDQPRRQRPKLPGAGEPAALGFLRSIGGAEATWARPFAVSLRVVDGDVAAAHATIARSPTPLAHGEGGIVHYRNEYPDDPHLRLWASLVARAHGNDVLADAELAAARTLGLDRNPRA
jgi:L-malate glycosyltransferase